MPFGIKLIFAAWVAYTVAVWYPWRGLTRPRVAWFAGGLISDFVGTYAMYVFRGSVWPLTLHGALGALALLIMGFHAGWAVYSCLQPRSRAASFFHRGSKWAYALWLAAFLTGALIAGGHTHHANHGPRHAVGARARFKS